MNSSPTESGNSPGQAALTPLLDTLFLLLFAVLASSDGATAREAAPEEIQIELPSVDDTDGAAASDLEAVPLVVTIEADGRIQMGDAGASPSTAEELAAALATVDPASSVEIRAHADARHAVVVEVLHGLRQAGLLDVRFVATRRDSDAGAGPLGGRSIR